jgi:Protein of unknown function (DUF3631)
MTEKTDGPTAEDIMDALADPELHRRRMQLRSALAWAEEVYADFIPNMSSGYRCISTLWAGHTHMVDADQRLITETTPRLAVLGDTPNCGKTTTLTLTQLLSRRGLRISARTSTSAGLLKAIQDLKVTLFIDQIEDVLTQRGRGAVRHLEIFETGYERGGQTLDASGLHPTFAPAAFAGLGARYLGNPYMEGLRTRSIMIFMEPLPEGQYDEDNLYDSTFHERKVKGYGETLGIAVRNMMPQIIAANPKMEGLRLRQRQIWRPLYVLAEVAGGDWPERIAAAAREAALGLETSKTFIGPREQLLEDIRYVLENTKGNLTSRGIYSEIVNSRLPSAQAWPTEFQGGRDVARALQELGLEPQQVWIDKSSRSGYKRAELEEALFGELEAKDEQPVQEPSEAE